MIKNTEKMTEKNYEHEKNTEKKWRKKTMNTKKNQIATSLTRQ